MDNNFLSGSVFCRLLNRMVEGCVTAIKTSAIARFILFIAARLRLWGQSSAIVRFCTRVADGFGAQLRGSAIIARFLKEDEAGRYRERGLVFRLYTLTLGLLRRLFHFLRLDRLFKDSILVKPWIWAMAAVALLPLLPTMAVLGFVLLSILSLVLTMLRDRDRTLRYFALNKYVWLYALVYGLATLASVTRRASLNIGLITICFVLFYQVLVSGIESKRQIRILLGILAGVGAVVSIIGFYQFIFSPTGGSQSWLDSGMFDYSGSRVYSTLDNPNVLGEYFLLIVPLTFGGMLIAKSNLGRAYYLLCALLMCLCLVLTYSRGCYLGILFAAAVFLVLLDRRFIVPGILAAALIFLLLPATIIDRFLSIGDMADSSTSYRVYIWQGTLAMLRDYWFSGVGPGEAAFNQVYPVYSFNSIIAPHAHNLFLQITCDAGVGGLLVFLGVIYQYFKATFAAIRRKIQGEQRILVIACTASVVGFMVQSMTDYTFYNYRVMLFFWAVLGLGVLCTRFDSLREE